MKTGALIVAAGMSSRMGDFKPMLNIGSISIAQRVVATFQQAGVDKIVMVTGYQAAMLEHHLAAALSAGQVRLCSVHSGGYPAFYICYGSGIAGKRGEACCTCI